MKTTQKTKLNKLNLISHFSLFFIVVAGKREVLQSLTHYLLSGYDNKKSYFSVGKLMQKIFISMNQENGKCE